MQMMEYECLKKQSPIFMSSPLTQLKIPTTLIMMTKFQSGMFLVTAQVPMI